MSERDELAAIISAPETVDHGPLSCGPNSTFAGRTADAILAAGYRKPRTVTTAEELDALAEGAVVLSDAYRYMMHGGADCGWPVSFQRWPDGDWHRGGRSASTHPDNFLPATILHEGTQP